MTIDEAIKELGNVKQLRVPIGELDELRACNLGIEALKLVDYIHNRIHACTPNPLPGETP